MEEIGGSTIYDASVGEVQYCTCLSIEMYRRFSSIYTTCPSGVNQLGNLRVPLKIIYAKVLYTSLFLLLLNMLADIPNDRIVRRLTR